MAAPYADIFLFLRRYAYGIRSACAAYAPDAHTSAFFLFLRRVLPQAKAPRACVSALAESRAPFRHLEIGRKSEEFAEGKRRELCRLIGGEQVEECAGEGAARVGVVV